MLQPARTDAAHWIILRDAMLRIVPLDEARGGGVDRFGALRVRPGCSSVLRFSFSVPPASLKQMKGWRRFDRGRSSL
jgi:hypothetical protein